MGKKSTDSSSVLADNGWVNPKLGVKIPSGAASGVVAPKFMSLGAQRRARRIRECPVPHPDSDPYWARGGLQPFTVDDLSDDEGDLSYLGDGLRGRPEFKFKYGNLRRPPAAMMLLSGGPAGDVGQIDADEVKSKQIYADEVKSKQIDADEVNSKQIYAEEVKPPMTPSVVKPSLKLTVRRPAPDEPDSFIRELGTQYSFPISNLELWEKCVADADREVEEMIRKGEW